MLRSMQRLLLLTRHADSDWDGDPDTDHERTLSARGHEQARLLPGLLAEQQLAPKLIVSSSATRAYTTATTVASNLDPSPPVERHQALYQGGMAALCAAVEPVADEVNAVMVVGHNPTISAIATRLSGQELRMRPATCVVLKSDADSWEEALDSSWQLVVVKRPANPLGGSA